MKDDNFRDAGSNNGSAVSEIDVVIVPARRFAGTPVGNPWRLCRKIHVGI